MTPTKPQESNGALNPQKQLIPRDLLETELNRLEGERQKGLALIKEFESELNCRRSDMLLIQGSIATLQAVLKESNVLTLPA
ncbi:MAG: hypothetical protein HY547_04950 [Elusimicrobia bacterium]|nr:hypothetical protein [Elusimicrobiota bacterium]